MNLIKNISAKDLAALASLTVNTKHLPELLSTLTQEDCDHIDLFPHIDCTTVPQSELVKRLEERLVRQCAVMRFQALWFQLFRVIRDQVLWQRRHEFSLDMLYAGIIVLYFIIALVNRMFD